MHKNGLDIDITFSQVRRANFDEQILLRMLYDKVMAYAQRSVGHHLLTYSPLCC